MLPGHLPEADGQCKRFPLPLHHQSSPLTPLPRFTYAPEIESWAMASQLHYSLLSHLESPSTLLSKYAFLTSTNLWNQQYERYSVNFMAIRAGKMARQQLFVNDEVMITMVNRTRYEPGSNDNNNIPGRQQRARGAISH